MSFEGCEYLYFGKVRVCYEGGNSKTGKKIYEMHKICKCESCKNRMKLRNESRNEATASTQDETKIEEVLQFLSNWSCKDGTKKLKTEYFKF